MPKKTFSIGRSAKTGKLTTIKKARRCAATHIVESMPKKGRGDTGRYRKKKK